MATSYVDDYHRSLIPAMAALRTAMEIDPPAVDDTDDAPRKRTKVVKAPRAQAAAASEGVETK